MDLGSGYIARKYGGPKLPTAGGEGNSSSSIAEVNLEDYIEDIQRQRKRLTNEHFECIDVGEYEQAEALERAIDKIDKCQKELKRYYWEHSNAAAAGEATRADYYRKLMDETKENCMAETKRLTNQARERGDGGCTKCRKSKSRSRSKRRRRHSSSSSDDDQRVANLPAYPPAAPYEPSWWSQPPPPPPPLPPPGPTEPMMYVAHVPTYR